MPRRAVAGHPEIDCVASMPDSRRIVVTCCVGALAGAFRLAAQDTVYTLPPVTVSVTRSDELLRRVPLTIHTVSGRDVLRARPAWGLDEVLATVPGVVIANRYNFSLDQRVAIRGFGARSAFAVRGVKLVVDGIPLTLPDGQGQLTAVELGDIDHIEVLNGAASALFGNAAGGVINITTGSGRSDAPAVATRVLAGAFDRGWRRAWTKWQAAGRTQLGTGGHGSVRVSRLSYQGERDHVAADLRTAAVRATLPLGSAWVLTVLGDGGDNPRADNPGALTLAELQRNRDSAAALNLLRHAGKAVRQVQGGVALRGRLDGADVTIATFGLTRDLENPLPQAFITLGRAAWGGRAQATRSQRLLGRELRLTGGMDLQWQRDDRLERNYVVPNESLTTADNRPNRVLRQQLERVSEFGPFARAVLAVSSALNVSAAVRHDRVHFAVEDAYLGDGVDNSGRRAFAATSGSAGLAWTTAGGVTIYSSVASSFETPTTTELNNQPPPSGGGFNPDLKAQRAVTVELGARGAVGASPGRLGWSAAVFHAAVRDELIAFEDTLVPGRRYFRNAANARHRGLELGVQARPAAGLELSLAWTLSDFIYTSYTLGRTSLNGRAIPGIPRHALRLVTRAEPGWWRGGWLVAEASHASGYLVDDTASARTQRWWQMDVRAGWQGTAGEWQLGPFVAVQNVFDAHYVSSVVINAARGRYYEPAPGRNAYLGVEVARSRKAALPRPSRRM